MSRTTHPSATLLPLTLEDPIYRVSVCFGGGLDVVLYADHPQRRAIAVVAHTDGRIDIRITTTDFLAYIRRYWDRRGLLGDPGGMQFGPDEVTAVFVRTQRGAIYEWPSDFRSGGIR